MSQVFLAPSYIQLIFSPLICGSILLIMLLQLSHFFFPLFPSTLHPSSHQHSPTLVHVHGFYIYKFFGFCISYAILNPPPLPRLFCAYHLCFLFPVPFAPFSHLPLPSNNPPCDLNFCGSGPILVVCLGYFCFCVLRSVVDSCEFVFFLLFIFLIIFFFLDKSL